MTPSALAARSAARCHFGFLADDERSGLFHCPPEPIGPDAPAELLALSLGATLYTPAVRADLAGVVLRQAGRGVFSMVLDLEDAVSDDEADGAQRSLIAQLGMLADVDPARRPLLFVRVRRGAQIREIVAALGGRAGVLTGFVLPKFDAHTGPAFLSALQQACRESGHHYYAMPVLESPPVILRESRLDALLAVRRLLERHRPRVLAVRIGATDLCGLYGLRRDRDLTIYDLRPVADVIADVVNILGRPDGTGFTVTAPVWEYFGDRERIFKPQLRATPFARQHLDTLRQRLVTEDLDGLIREVVLDKANGLAGKTVIHPSHVAAVHALSVVSHEEYCDARDILASARPGGVRASCYGNKMNEPKPHRFWAERTLRRARVFGVAQPGTTFIDLLVAGAPH